MSVGGVFRVLRAAVFAAVCVVLAAIGHVLMSGSPISWWVLLGCTTAVGGLAWALGGAERGRSAVVALTVAVQTCLHICFTLAQTGRQPAMAAPDDGAAIRQWASYLLCGADPDPGAAARAYDLAVRAGLTHSMRLPSSQGTGTMRHAGHVMPGTGDMAGMPGMSSMPGMTGMHHMDGMTGTASWGMLLAHLLAAVLCGLWLAQGERAAFRLLRALADRAFVPLRLVLAVLLPVPRRPLCRPRRRRVRRPRRLLLVHTLTTRGPPREIAVL
ncbi:hypothetical protein [Streptomyces sp. MMG1121]|uniref:hypothetical protein n=1 Tax=Streptomyces sp. MMG1121 TaxID=1415544 RepID=UPI0006AEE0AC|nr:hypothetical protein [Streptomyces sp. MMG1121]KOV60467.1 hypothetical protein ADK64_30200 [Streptomyces sp. MMG1121]